MNKTLLAISLFIGLSINILAYNYGTIEENTLGCEKGLALSCSNLGANYLSDDKKLAEFYYTKGTELFRKYCETGNGKACYDLGDRFHGTLFSIDSNLSAVAKYYHKACENKYGKACIELGASYKRGSISLERNNKKSLDYYAKGVEYLKIECNENIAESCSDLSTIYSAEMYGTNDTNRGLELKAKAFELYDKMCTLKDDEGCYQVATSYYFGSSVKIDWIKAKEYYKKSCEYGQESACWRGKDIDIDKQIEYEKKLELMSLTMEFALKEKLKRQSWNDRMQRQRREVNELNKTRAEKDELLKKYKLENISWKKKSDQRLENEKRIFEEKKRKILSQLK